MIRSASTPPTDALPRRPHRGPRPGDRPGTCPGRQTLQDHRLGGRPHGLPLPGAGPRGRTGSSARRPTSAGTTARGRSGPTRPMLRLRRPGTITGEFGSGVAVRVHRRQRRPSGHLVRPHRPRGERAGHLHADDPRRHGGGRLDRRGGLDRRVRRRARPESPGSSPASRGAGSCMPSPSPSSSAPTTRSPTRGKARGSSRSGAGGEPNRSPGRRLARHRRRARPREAIARRVVGERTATPCVPAARISTLPDSGRRGPYRKASPPPARHRPARSAALGSDGST